MSLDHLTSGLCRCCQSEGMYQSLSRPCVYADCVKSYECILNDTLDINLKAVPGPISETTHLICEDCIMKLKTAFLFKRQVRSCEDMFQKMLEENTLKVGDGDVIIKEETEDANNEFMNTDDFIWEDSVSEDYIIKEETENEKEHPRSKEIHTNGNGKKVKPLSRRNLRPKRSDIDVQETETQCGAMTEFENFLAEKSNTKKKHKTRITKSPKNKGTSKRLIVTDFTVTEGIYKCKICDKSCTTPNGIRNHIRTVHLNINKYSCSICLEGFTSQARFTVHKLEIHNIDDRFKCNACDNVFNTSIQVRKHVKIFHMLGQKHKCKLCDYECYSSEGIYKHSFKHKTVKDFHCKFCKKSFLRKSNLDMHEKIHTGVRNKVCKECGQAFVQKASLNYHMAKYHPGVPF